MANPARPELHFNSIDNVIADVDAVPGRPCEHTGNWDLPRMLDHLAKGFSIPYMTNPPRVAWPARGIARFFVRRMLRADRYPNFSAPMPKELTPTDTISPDQAYS